MVGSFAVPDSSVLVGLMGQLYLNLEMHFKSQTLVTTVLVCVGW